MNRMSPILIALFMASNTRNGLTFISGFIEVDVSGGEKVRVKWKWQVKMTLPMFYNFRKQFFEILLSNQHYTIAI